MNERHRIHLQRTLERARNVEPVAGARVAATLVWKGDSWCGINSRKTHPLMAKFGKNEKAICLHAEIDAIKNCMKRVPPQEFENYPATLYIARAKADGSSGLAKPCEGCQRAIVAFGIEEVYWTE